MNMRNADEHEKHVKAKDAVIWLTDMDMLGIAMVVIFLNTEVVAELLA